MRFFTVALALLIGLISGTMLLPSAEAKLGVNGIIANGVSMNGANLNGLVPQSDRIDFSTVSKSPLAK